MNVVSHENRMSVQATNLAVPRIDTRQVDLGHELYGRRGVRVIFTAVDVKVVDSIFMSTVRGSKNCPVPIRHHHIITFSQAIGTGLCILILARHPSFFQYDKNSIPAPSPFSPFSSSSNNRKFLGSFAPIVTQQPPRLTMQANHRYPLSRKVK